RFCKYGLGDELLIVCAEIWDALRAATDADLTLAQTIVDSAGIIVSNPDLTLCYDERGAKYELPNYVLSEPTNLIRDG
uniref:DC-UbP/UBTD2 N-terminal domain-containing protein n=2 Tax=Aegilops tauschii TaxID=37682 RepID=A0A452ZMD0_AEGTS